jgi:hypothetical protein
MAHILSMLSIVVKGFLVMDITVDYIKATS